MSYSLCDIIKIAKQGARENLLPFLLVGYFYPTNLLTIYYKRGKIKMAMKYVAPTYERIDKPDSKGNFFVRLAYGVVGSYMDTKSMTTQEVIEEFLNHNGVKTPRDFFDKRFKGGKKPQAEPKTENGAIVEESKTPESNPYENPREIKSNVEKAKTTKEAEQIAKEKLGIDADYSGMDVSIANAMNESFSVAIQFCPEVKENFKSTGSAQRRNEAMKQSLIDLYTDRLVIRGWSKESALEYAKKLATKTMKSQSISARTVAFSWTNENKTPDVAEALDKHQGIFFNNRGHKTAEEIDREQAIMVEIGHSPQGCGSTKAVFDHECGHQIADYLGLAENPEMVGFYRECVQNGEIGKGLSGYATTNINEFIAEGWAEYLNNTNQKPIAKRIGEIIIKANKEKRK